MKINISDPKTKKSYSKSVDSLPALFVNTKLGAIVSLDEIGLHGFEAKITGGSDKDGFPMHRSIVGTGRKKIFSYKGIGFRIRSKGIRTKKSVRGHSIGSDLAQINVVVTKGTSDELNRLLGTEPKKEDSKKSVKEEMIERSLAAVGDDAAAEEAKKIKGKTKG